MSNFRDKNGELIYKPIVLDSKDKYTKLLIVQIHETYSHGNHETVLNELRQNYWILSLRQALRSLVSNCEECKKLRGKPANPRMAALPIGRLACRKRPFSHCGVDCFGPLFIKIGRRREKRWGVLFTCLTAVSYTHLTLPTIYSV